MALRVFLLSWGHGVTALSAINSFLLKVAQRAEVLGAVVVMAIVFIFIVPLPTWLVDILIALNICISCLLIVLALYLPGPWRSHRFRQYCC